MNLYRCTRNSLYTESLCEGHINIAKRNSYWVEAKNKLQALKIMSKKFPDDKEGFSVELWDKKAIDKEDVIYVQESMGFWAKLKFRYPLAVKQGKEWFYVDDRYKPKS